MANDSDSEAPRTASGHAKDCFGAMPPSMVMVGAFPPPVHGMAAVNAAVHNAVQQVGVTPLVINIAASSLERSLIARLDRLPKVLRGLGRLARQRGVRGRVLYMSISGGFGQLYEIAFLLLARLRGMRVFLHHHSFAYLDTPGALTRALVRAAGDGAVHVALSPEMAERLKRHYDIVHTVAISNAVFFIAADTAGAAREEPTTIGFLSNISAEKGVFEFLDLMAAAQADGLPVRGRLAGPFQDADTERSVRSRLQELPSVEYVGARYGAAKTDYFRSIDVLVFPTRYVNEAEPVTVHEAMSHAIPVIAYGRGCIPEIIDDSCGLVVDPEQPFLPAALEQLTHWLADPQAFQATSKTAVAHFTRRREENDARWHALLARLTGNDGAVLES